MYAFKKTVRNRFRFEKRRPVCSLTNEPITARQQSLLEGMYECATDNINKSAHEAWELIAYANSEGLGEPAHVAVSPEPSLLVYMDANIN